MPRLGASTSCSALVPSTTAPPTMPGRARSRWSRFAGSSPPIFPSCSSKPRRPSRLWPARATRRRRVRCRPEPAWSARDFGQDAEMSRQARMAQLRQRLGLDLTDALTRELEAPADLLERERLLVGQTEPQAEHLAFARIEPQQRLAQCGGLERTRRGLVRRRGRRVGQEIGELGAALVADD